MRNIINFIITFCTFYLGGYLFPECMTCNMKTAIVIAITLPIAISLSALLMVVLIMSFGIEDSILVLALSIVVIGFIAVPTSIYFLSKCMPGLSMTPTAIIIVSLFLDVCTISPKAESN